MKWLIRAVAVIACLAIGGGINHLVEVRPCQEAVAAADALIGSTSDGLYANVDVIDALADDDLTALILANREMDKLLPVVQADAENYSEARSECS